MTVGQKISWTSQARCRGEETERWFSDIGNTRANSLLIRQAKQVCQACPVRLECLNHALDAKEEFGIWGGLTARERGFGRHRPIRTKATQHP